MSSLALSRITFLEIMLNKDCKIYLAGHNGTVGSACLRALNNSGFRNIIVKNSNELDLRKIEQVNTFIRLEKPDAIIHAAAKAGGILANSKYPYDFLMDNLLIQNSIIQSAHQNDIKKLIFFGSSSVYPKFAPQPYKEESLLTGELEPTVECYAVAKISGIKLLEALRKQHHRDYVALLPTNLYGTNDNFSLESSHVFPAMIRKFHEAKINGDKEVILWGSGSPKREFLNVEDLGQAVLFALKNTLKDSVYNVGTGIEITISDLAERIKSVVGFNGRIVWDVTKPDGASKKLMDSSRLSKEGWKARVELNDGITSTYNWFIDNISIIREKEF